MKRTNLLLMVLPLLFVAACSASAELPASSASAPTAVEPAAPADPTATAAAPTAESAGDTSAAEAAVAADPPEESAPADAAAVEPVDWLTVMGRTDEGLATLGNPDATVTMIDYSDFMWPTCRAHVLGVEQQLKEAYVQSGLVRMVFNPVLNHGDRSYVTHQAAECAGEQNSFWDFREFLYAQQDRLWTGDVRATVKELAVEAGLNAAAFNSCLDEQRYYDRVDQQDALRRANGIRSQPSFAINGDIRVGPAPFEAFAQLLDQKLAAVQ